MKQIIRSKQIIPLVIKIISIILISGYIFFQFRRYLMGPKIESVSLSSYTATTSDVVTLSGTLRNADFIWLDGRQIFTNRDGYFHEDLALVPGYTIRTLRVKDRYGRTSAQDFGIYLDKPDPHDSYSIRIRPASTSTSSTTHSLTAGESTSTISTHLYGTSEENNNES